ncbi:MAG: glycoside hydrolase family 13 protein [Microbacterium sp.]
MTVLPHHDGSPLYVSNATPVLGEQIEVRLRVPHGYGPIDQVLVRSRPDDEPRYDKAVLTGSADGWDWWTATITVVNPRTGYRWFLLFADGGVQEYNQSGLTAIEALDVFDFAVIAGNEPPGWMTDAVMYQIVPDRFARSAAADDREVPDWAIPAAWDEPVELTNPGRTRQFYGGDLDGVIERLDHLQDLGVNLVYHTPIFPARSNHRYDSANFSTVDPLLGGEEAYCRLISAVHERGMRIMGDLTTNHSGDQHEWFRAAHRHPEAPESSFYYFKDADNEDYESWLGTSSLPKFNWNSRELRRRFIYGADSVVAKWLAEPYCTDGWRIDVANMTGRRGVEDLNEGVRTTVRDTMVDINPDTLLVAEFGNDASADFQGDAWHGAMTYAAFTRGVWSWLAEPQAILHQTPDGELSDEVWFFGLGGGMRSYTARQFVEQQQRFTAQLPWRVQLGCMLALDSHDTARFATHADAAAIPLAVGLMMTLPGIPMVFAGDEFGLAGVDGEDSRTPIPWHRVGEPEVAERIDLYRQLIAMRHAHVALQTGGLRWLHADDDTLVFARESEEETVLVVAGAGEVRLDLPASAVAGIDGAELLFGAASITAGNDGAITITGSGPCFAAWRLAGVRRG